MNAKSLPAPPRLHLWWRLVRADRPIGVYLLLWPTLSALWLAADGWPGWHLLLVFVLGTWLTRSAGCAVNDFADRKIDGFVERTRERPLATGALAASEALWVAAVLALLALALVMTTNALTIALSVPAALVAIAYPFTKRYTDMPQAVLGVAFSFGIPMAFAAVQGQLPVLMWAFFVLNLVWVVAYDTMYAMSDREEDLKIGVRSSAIFFGRFDVLVVMGLQTLFLLGVAMLAVRLHLGWMFGVGWMIAAALVVFQYTLIRDRERGRCLQAFLNNHWVGLALWGAIVLGQWSRV